MILYMISSFYFEFIYTKGYLQYFVVIILITIHRCREQVVQFRSIGKDFKSEKLCLIRIS